MEWVQQLGGWLHRKARSELRMRVASFVPPPVRWPRTGKHFKQWILDSQEAQATADWETTLVESGVGGEVIFGLIEGNKQSFITEIPIGSGLCPRSMRVEMVVGWSIS